MLPKNEVKTTASEPVTADPVASDEADETTPIIYRSSSYNRHMIFDPSRVSPPPTKRPNNRLKTALSIAAGGATTLPIYLPLSWQAGQNINANLGITTTLASLPIPAAITFCSAIANLALSTDKFDVTIDRLPELTQLLAGAFKTLGGFSHLLADAFFVLASAVGAISLTDITYELYEKNFFKLALIPAGLIALGRIMIGTTALVDLKNSILWWVNVLRDPTFKANQELILLLNDIELLLQKCTSEEVAKLKLGLDNCISEEAILSCLLAFAQEKGIQLTSFTLLNKGLLIRLVTFIVIGIPASIIYYNKAAAGIATTLALSTHDGRTIIASVLSVLPILTLQGMASQKAIYEIGHNLYKRLQNHACREMISDSEDHHSTYRFTEWLAASFTSQSIYYALRAPIHFIFNLKTISTIIGVGSSASAIQIAITAAGGSLPLLLLYIPPAATAAALTNILSMKVLTDKLTTQTTAQQEEVIAEIKEIKTYLTELFKNDSGEKIMALREQANSFESPSPVIIDMPEENVPLDDAILTHSKEDEGLKSFIVQRIANFRHNLFRGQPTIANPASINAYESIDATESRCVIC